MYVGSRTSMMLWLYAISCRWVSSKNRNLRCRLSVHMLHRLQISCKYAERVKMNVALLEMPAFRFHRKAKGARVRSAFLFLCPFSPIPIVKFCLHHSFTSLCDTIQLYDIAYTREREFKVCMSHAAGIEGGVLIHFMPEMMCATYAVSKY